MIYPTRRTVLLAAALAPIGLAVGIVAPAWWTAGLLLLGLLLLLCIVDGAAGASGRALEAWCEGPEAVGVGAPLALRAELRFRRAAPAAAEIALGLDGPAEPEGSTRRAIPLSDGAGVGEIGFRAARRGTVRVERLWVRWRGRLGLVWKQKEFGLGHGVRVIPDIRALRESGARLQSRDAAHGLVAQRQLGEGAEFDALADYRQGMDRRAIDWKTSARHTRLVAKEYRTERNHNIVMALDAGRAMCEPQGGVPRLDKAVSAALLTAFAALKEGDRVGLFAFDSHPLVSSRPVSGPRAFAMLQRVAAGLDYSTRETNYTLALATLAGELSRRSLIVVFTEFSDPTSAELMVKAIGPLLRKHLVLFLVLRDEELEAFTAAEPRAPDDISRAVTAASLLRERRLVMTRLRHLGVRIVEAPAAEAGPALLSAYLDLKRRNLL